MKTLTKSLFIALTISTFTVVATVPVSAAVPKAPHRAVAYQVGVYGSVDGTKLNIAVDKQIGGRVNVVFKDARGNDLFRRSIHKTDSKYRVSLDISSLVAGQYQLEISNGQAITVRSLTIQAQEPTLVATRTIALL